LTRGFDVDAYCSHLGVLLFLLFVPDDEEAMGLRGPSCLTCVRVFQGDLSTPIRAPLIMVPDTLLLIFGQEKLEARPYFSFGLGRTSRPAGGTGQTD